MTKQGLFTDPHVVRQIEGFRRLYGADTGRSRYYAEMAEYNERDVKAALEWVKSRPPAEQAAQKAIAGGLQPHSVGGSYPFHPVYIANGTAGHWEVHNLQTGQKLYHWLTLHHPFQTRAQRAIDLAAAASDGKLDSRYFEMH